MAWPPPVGEAGVTGPRTCVAGAVGVQSGPSQGQTGIGHVYASTAGSLVVHQSDICQSGRAAGSDGDGAALSVGIGVTSEVGALHMGIESVNTKLRWASSFELARDLLHSTLGCSEHQRVFEECCNKMQGHSGHPSLGGLPLASCSHSCNGQQS